MIIDELFSGINKYISDNLSVGAKIIINQCNRQEELLDRIDKRTEMLNSEIGSKVYPDSQMERNTKELIIRIKEYQANNNFA